MLVLGKFECRPQGSKTPLLAKIDSEKEMRFYKYNPVVVGPKDIVKKNISYIDTRAKSVAYKDGWLMGKGLVLSKGIMNQPRLYFKIQNPYRLELIVSYKDGDNFVLFELYRNRVGLRVMKNGRMTPILIASYLPLYQKEISVIIDKYRHYLVLFIDGYLIVSMDTRVIPFDNLSGKAGVFFKENLPRGESQKVSLPMILDKNFKLNKNLEKLPLFQTVRGFNLE